MNRRHVIVLLLLYLQNFSSINASCTLSDSKSGICADIRRCKNVDIGENLKICSFTSISLIVCCAPEFVEPERKSQKFCDDFNLNENKLISDSNSTSEESKFPYVALLGYPIENSTKWICGGTLIAPKFILTSAHCLSESSKEIKIARLGYTKLYIQYEAPQDFVVMRIINHPKFDKYSRYHDIALLELDKEVKYTNYVKPACLHNEKELGLIGMTATALIDVGFFAQPDIRLVVFENLVEYKNFSKYSYPKKYFNRGFEEDLLILAGKYNGHTNQGKSGEGITSTYKMYGGTYRLIGIKTSTFDLNATKSDVDVYIRISHYLDWIESIVWPNQYNDNDICTLQDGTQGICINIKNCKGAKIGSNETEICSYSENTPIVCCTFSPVTTIISKSQKFCNTLKRNYTSSNLRNTYDNEFPHMVALGFISTSNSTPVLQYAGSLISEKFVITAAHCTTTRYNGEVKFVRVGTIRLFWVEVKDFNIKRIHVYSEYKDSQKYHDIALLELERPVQYSDSIRPACLFTEKEVPRWLKMLSTAWERIGFGGTDASHLQVLEGIEEYKNCSNYFNPSKTLKIGIVKEWMICAGKSTGALCQGSSGGPLASFQHNMYHIIGVVSFGKFCGLYNTPMVYTRISNYLNWIESIVWPN